jgi:hydrogenase maturation protease
MQAHDQSVAPILALGVGNILLGDDGAGPALLQEVAALYKNVAAVECIDGGTQGMALLDYLTGREALVILDAFATGRGAGTVSVLEGSEVLNARGPRSTTAHEGNAGELLSAAALVGILPGHLFLVGIEPEILCTRLGLSEPVRKALAAALIQACGVIERVLAELRRKGETSQRGEVDEYAEANNTIAPAIAKCSSQA